MARYECSVCGYVYDEKEGGKAWKDLPEDWTCPNCGAAKSQFVLIEEQAEGAPAVQSRSVFILAHRIFGYVFLVMYLFFLWQMVPRLWTYQIEFPARTVVHLTLGMAIGAILVLKILIVRYFGRLDQTLVPMLGACLFVGTVVLIGVSAPFALHEALAQRAPTAGGLFGAENLQRVRTLLAQTGLGEAECERWASVDSLRSGQIVLRRQCVECHDLRTVLAKPRTPRSWRETVRRMADRTTVLDPLDEDEQWQVTAYLIAISPELQRSAQQMRDQEALDDRTRRAVEAVAKKDAAEIAFDPQQVKPVFEAKCSGCHAVRVVERSPPKSQEEARRLVARMVDEGLTATEEELAGIVKYLTAVYAEKSSE